jgi:hypothetical protein
MTSPLSDILKQLCRAGSSYERFGETDNDNADRAIARAEQAILALLEEAIGEDEELVSKSFGLSQNDVYMPSDTIVDIRNDLRNEIRAKLGIGGNK